MGPCVRRDDDELTGVVGGARSHPSSFRGSRSENPESKPPQSKPSVGFSDVQLHIVVRAKWRAPE
jgi:hypothetical protein